MADVALRHAACSEAALGTVLKHCRTGYAGASDEVVPTQATNAAD